MKVDQLFGKARSFVRRLKPAAPWIGGIGGAVLISFLGWFLLTELPQRNVPVKVDEDIKRRADVINSNRENVLKVVQTVAGLGFIATAYLAWRNSQLAEDKNVTDRFSKAVEMLADEKLEMRLGGIYSLERIARDSKEDHPVVMEVLTAFVRDRAGKTEDVQHGSFVSSFIAQQQSQGADEKAATKPSQDIQSALTVIGRRNIKNDQQRINLAGTNLQGADLRKAHLEGAYLKGVHLEGANLWKAHLEEANLWKAHLEEATLWKAHLEGATLSEAHLEGATLSEAHLEEANLWGAHLEKAYLTEAHLEKANLWGAHLERANLRGAHLERANLRGVHLDGAYLGRAHLDGAKNLTKPQLSQAKLCRTRLPQGINLDPNRDCEELGLPFPPTDEIASNEDIVRDADDD